MAAGAHLPRRVLTEFRTYDRGTYMMAVAKSKQQQLDDLRERIEKADVILIKRHGPRNWYSVMEYQSRI